MSTCDTCGEEVKSLCEECGGCEDCCVCETDDSDEEFDDEDY